MKLLYGRAFRAPNPFELYYDQTTLSAELAPERIVTHEIVWEQRVDPRLQITASVFHNRVTDLISQRSGSDTVDDLYFANGGAVKARGVEFEANAELPGRLRARLAHAMHSARGIADGGGLSNSPGHVSTLVLDVPIDRLGLLFALDTYHVGARRTVRGGTAKAAFVSNLTVSRRLSAVDVALSLRNLFDADYGDPGSEEHRQQVIPQDGRTASVRATWRF